MEDDDDLGSVDLAPVELEESDGEGREEEDESLAAALRVLATDGESAWTAAPAGGEAAAPALPARPEARSAVQSRGAGALTGRRCWRTLCATSCATRA